MSGSGEFSRPGRRTDVQSYNNITPVISDTLRGDVVIFQLDNVVIYHLENVVKNCLKMHGGAGGGVGGNIGGGEKDPWEVS